MHAVNPNPKPETPGQMSNLEVSVAPDRKQVELHLTILA